MAGRLEEHGEGGGGLPIRRRLGNVVVLAGLAVLSYFGSIVLFLVGFLIIPNGGYERNLLFGDAATFVSVATRLQDLVIVVIPGSLIVASALALWRLSLGQAAAVMFTINGMFWLVLTGVYVAGIVAGAFSV